MDRHAIVGAMSDMPNPSPEELDQFHMRRALHEALRAEMSGEVPVGAVVVLGGEIIGVGFNRVVSDHDPTAHAEVVALRQASARLANYRLPGATLYATVEPCAMCAGAAVLARVGRLVYGCDDPKAGAVSSLYKIATDDRLNHRIELNSGVLAEECAALLRKFFRDRRAL
jgi:tRNA(adenine34) deaminase